MVMWHELQIRASGGEILKARMQISDGGGDGYRDSGGIRGTNYKFALADNGL